MKVFKKANGKTSVQISRSEWNKIGIEKGWITSQFQPQLQQKPKAPQPIAQEIVPFDGGNLAEEITNHVSMVAENYVSPEQDGIGDYEFQGQRGFDKGSTFDVFDGFTLAVDITGSAYDSFHHAEHFEEIPYVTGNFRTNANSEIYWAGSGQLKQHNGRIYAVYNIEQAG